MMRLDTSGIAGWEDKCVVLEFEHDTPMADYDEDGDVVRKLPRCSTARLVEFVTGGVLPPSTTEPWEKVPSGWKRRICGAVSRCSLADQFCRETGRRVALRRLAAITGRATYTTLRKAAIQQYFQDRAARKREGAAA